MCAQFGMFYRVWLLLLHCVFYYLLFCRLNDSPRVHVYVCALEKFTVSVFDRLKRASKKEEENAIYKTPLEILLKWIKVMYKFGNNFDFDG